MIAKFGIVGLPNIGKSTFFNFITNLNVRTENFPFCTITPNIGKMYIFDNRIIKIANIINTKRILNSYIKIIDIAGLIKGSSSGKGLGNKFLSYLNNVDAIFHVVRSFKDKSIKHIYGEYNPIRDIDIINTELMLSDIDNCKKVLSIIKVHNSITEKIKFFLIKKCIYYLNKSIMLNMLEFNEHEKVILQNLNFITNKPVIYIINIDRTLNNNILTSIKKKIASLKSKLLLINVKENNKTRQVENNDNIKKLFEYSCKLLNLHNYFTIVNSKVSSWLISIGCTAYMASKNIHSDFAKGFIKAHVIHYQDFIQYNGEIGAKKHGKISIRGKNYIIKNGDIIKFLYQKNMQ